MRSEVLIYVYFRNCSFVFVLRVVLYVVTLYYAVAETFGNWFPSDGDWRRFQDLHLDSWHFSRHWVNKKKIQVIETCLIDVKLTLKLKKKKKKKKKEGAFRNFGFVSIKGRHFWALNHLTLKIWLSILPSSCSTFPYKVVKRSWRQSKITSTW